MKIFLRSINTRLTYQTGFLLSYNQQNIYLLIIEQWTLYDIDIWIVGLSLSHTQMCLWKLLDAFQNIIVVYLDQ